MPRLFTISYRSTSRMRDPQLNLLPLVSRSRRNNRACGITGLLMFDGTHFMQTIEGPEAATADLFLQILEDPRHHDIVPFGIEAIEMRRFPTWELRLLGTGETLQIAPDLGEFDFSDRRLRDVHRLAGAVGLDG